MVSVERGRGDLASATLNSVAFSAIKSINQSIRLL